MNYIKKVGTWLKTHKIVTIIIGIVAIGGVIFGFKLYKDSHLSYGVYRNCKDGICEYIMFTKSGKVYMIKQNIKDAETLEERDNYKKLIMKHGVDNIVNKCNGYGYCDETLNITEKFSGIYSLNDGKIKVERDFNNNDITYYQIKDGKLYELAMNLETTLTSYYPVENYNKWNKCRKNNNCDKVFSIVDPLSDFDYNAVYKNFESSIQSQDCKYSKEYAFKDITGDGIDEILIRSSVDGKEWHLEQIFYINTWQGKVLPLGDDLPYNYTEISEVYEGGYIYLSGNDVKGSYYKTSSDGYVLEYYEADSKYDLPSRKSLYDEISDWKVYPKDEKYCAINNNTESNNNDNLEDKNKVSENENIYEEILTQNRQYLMGLVDTPPKGNIDYVFPELEEDIKAHLAYTFYDLNHDGKDELIIGQDGSYYGNDYIEVFSIYKYDNQGKVEVIPVSGGNKNNASIDILEDGYFEVGYGWQNSQSRAVYGNMKEDNKVVSNWNDLGEIVKYDFYEDSDSNWELRLDIYNRGKLIESHKPATWDDWKEINEKPLADLTTKKRIDLSDLKWEYILQLD